MVSMDSQSDQRRYDKTRIVFAWALTHRTMDLINLTVCQGMEFSSLRFLLTNAVDASR
jgi:hypothetical protein